LSSRQLRWAVLIVDLEPVLGHEQGGERRALVVSYEPLHRGGLMAVCPITAERSAPKYPGDVAIPAGEGGQTMPGVIVCHQLRTLSVMRAKRLAGYLTDPDLRAEVRSYLARHLGLDIPASEGGATGGEVYGPQE
jgi:mRNA-degrading endonuclease toxin of MazEF toxin-antitoxin module